MPATAADDDAERGRGQGHQQELPPAVEIRLSTSRPRVSPPRRSAFDGWAKGRVTKFVGEYGVTKGPMTATRTTKVDDDEAEGPPRRTGCVTRL